MGHDVGGGVPTDENFIDDMVKFGDLKVGASAEQ